MPPKKRQHYVPRFYLKNFSIGAVGKSIGIFNIDSKKFIPNGSLKEQAYKDYFYGKDGVIENILAIFETSASVVIRNIIQHLNCPAWISQDRLQLLIFATFLHSRTEYAADESKEQTEQVFDTLYPEGAGPEDMLANEVKDPLPPAEILKSTMLCTPMASDLDYRIIVNRTGIPFITSDNPCVYYNRFLENRTSHGSNVGLGVKGLQIFLPISPMHLIVFFDSGVYRVGKKTQICIDTVNEYDVNGLNYLQFISSYHNLYFNEKITSQYLLTNIRKLNKFKRANKTYTKEYVLGKMPDGSNRSIIHMYGNDIKINLNLSFIEVKPKAKNYNLGNKAVHLRNEELYEIYSAFLDAVQRQKYRFNQLNEFFQDWMSRSSQP